MILLPSSLIHDYPQSPHNALQLCSIRGSISFSCYVDVKVEWHKDDLLHHFQSRRYEIVRFLRWRELIAPFDIKATDIQDAA